MATLYETNGNVREVTPHGAAWALEELESIVGGRHELLRTVDGRVMVINDTGKVQKPMLPLNVLATRIYVHGRRDPVLGPALVVDSRTELEPR